MTKDTKEIAVVLVQPDLAEKVKSSPDLDYVLLIGFYDFWKNRAIAYNYIGIQNADATDLTLRRQQIESHLPAGISIIGLWKPDSQSDISEISDWPETRALSSNVQSCRFLVITEPFEAEALPSSALLFLCEFEAPCFDSSINVTSLSKETSASAFDESISLRASVDLSVNLHINNSLGSSDSIKEELVSAFLNVESRFSTVRPDADNDLQDDRYFSNVYKTNAGQILLSDSSQNHFVLDKSLSAETANVMNLLKFLNASSDDKTFKRKGYRFSQDHLDFTLFQDISTKENSNVTKYVPIIHYTMGEFTNVSIPLKLKPIVICSVNTKLVDLPYLLNEAILRQIRCARFCVTKFSKFNTLKDISGCEPFIFYPPGLDHFLVVHYPKNISDDDLKEYRSELCKLWGLVVDRPILRRNNAFKFFDERGGYLRNVHDYVGRSGLKDAICAIVDGNYEYRHYMQDNYDDRGWGCAYRSFQTVWSWFLLQGYTNKPVPSHAEIQQALIDMGDKPKNFLGMKQWIGSLELSYCLSHLIQVESKIINVSSGAEMSSKVRQLIDHFHSEGTPVMIGGGVLAHTILGVNFSEDTGEIKYMVLDPHYTGDENIKTIVDKGWCGWKNEQFWSNDAFYNLLLPQRPRNIV